MQSDEIDSRVERVAKYIAETGATVRNAATKFCVSKSTVHKDITTRLKYIDPELFDAVSKVLATNRAERHIRGGMATKQRFKKVGI